MINREVAFKDRLMKLQEDSRIYFEKNHGSFGRHSSLPNFLVEDQEKSLKLLWDTVPELVKIPIQFSSLSYIPQGYLLLWKNSRTENQYLAIITKGFGNWESKKGPVLILETRKRGKKTVRKIADWESASILDFFREAATND